MLMLIAHGVTAMDREIVQFFHVSNTWLSKYEMRLND